jgi:hypothetical protein
MIGMTIEQLRAACDNQPLRPFVMHLSLDS